MLIKSRKQVQSLYTIYTHHQRRKVCQPSIGDIAIKSKRAVKRNTNINMVHNARTEYREFRTSNSKINLFMFRKPRAHKHKRAILKKKKKKARIKNHSKCWYSQASSLRSLKDSEINK